jgi:hypothetical protein
LTTETEQDDPTQDVVQDLQDDPTQDVVQDATQYAGQDDQPQQASDSTPKSKKRSPPLFTLCVGCRHYVLKTDLPNHECRLPPFLRIELKPSVSVSLISL